MPELELPQPRTVTRTFAPHGPPTLLERWLDEVLPVAAGAGLVAES
jgi:hypothetical protein